MSNYTFHAELENADKIERAFERFPEEARKAMYSTIKRTQSRTVTKISSDVRNEYTIKRKDIKPQISIDKATLKGLECVISVSGRQVKMTVMKYRKNTKKKYAKVQVKRGQWKQTKNLFLIDSKYSKGKELVYKDDNKLRTAYTLSVPQMVSNKKVIESITKDSANFMQDRFLKHDLPFTINAMIKKANAGG